ncbi:MAG: hypothetical protein HC890_15365 [Chloroflexaceae bacterium]|nr:hypothetical protein [Chloroflexaceae bacterium]
MSHLAFKLRCPNFAILLGAITLSAGFGQSAIAAPVGSAWLNPLGTNSGNTSLVSQATPPDVTIDTVPNGSTAPGTTTSNTGDARFVCQFVNGQYTVMYLPQSRSGERYPWAIPRQLGSGWTPERRCTEIARRLESYRPDGLIELTTGVENGYNTVCVTTERQPGCRIVFTVPPGQDPFATRDRVFDNLLAADSGQATQGVNTFAGRNSGGSVVNQVGRALNIPGLGGTQRTANGAINLRPFLDPADGGTGAQLRQPTAKPAQPAPSTPPATTTPAPTTPAPTTPPATTTPPSNGRTLNPNLFR